MFDKYHSHKSKTKVLNVSKETIIEKTITPDKVTDMYDKIKKEIVNDNLKIYKIKSSIIDGVILYSINPETMYTEVNCRIQINNKDVFFKFDQINRFNQKEVVKKLNEKIREIISEHLLDFVIEKINQRKI